MRKILGLSVVLAVAALAGCRDETVGEKVERKIRNAGDKLENAADELK